MASQDLEVLFRSRILERRRLAQEKRERDMQLIQDINSNGTFPPIIPSRDQDDLVLRKLLSKFRRPLDMNNVTQSDSSESSPDNLQRIKEVLTVIGVLKIMKKKGYGLEDEKSKKFTKRDVLTLRLVNKSCKEAVEYVFMNEYVGDWYLHFQDKLKFNWTAWGSFPNVTSFSIFDGARKNVTAASGEQIDRAMNVLQNSSSKSISALISTLHIDDRGWRNAEEFKAKLTKFSETYGGYIQGLLIKCDDTATMGSRYKRLLDLVTLMPNLKALVMDFNSVFPKRPVRPNVDAEDLEGIVKQYPFLSIPSLELVRFDDMADKSVAFEILEKNVDLKSLKLPTNLRLFDDAMLETLNNMRFLKHYVGYENLRTQLLLNVTWPLKKLRIRELFRDKMDQYIPILNRFGGTLEELRLNYLSVNTLQARLDLPRLKKLEISDLHDCDSLNFLIPLQSLEHLVVLELKVTTKDVVIRLIEFSRNPDVEKRRASSVWRYLPNLRKVELRGFRMPGNFPFVSNGNGGYKVVIFESRK